LHELHETGSARWDEKKEGGWKERMDEWKMQQGNLGPEQDDDAEAAMYVSGFYIPSFSRKCLDQSCHLCNYELALNRNHQAGIE
jgi:hypothetical protein